LMGGWEGVVGPSQELREPISLAVAELLFKLLPEIMRELSKEAKAPQAEFGCSDVDPTGLLDEIDEAAFLELLHSHPYSLPGEAEEPSEFGDMHLPIEINRFESSVLSECDPERLERLIHEDLYAVLKAAHGGDDLPTGGEAVVLAHRMSSYLAGVTVQGGSRLSRCDVKTLTNPAIRSRLNVSRGYRQTPRTRSVGPCQVHA
jgi:hypothetical protein